MASPLISLVCGTYNRLETLKRMIASVQDGLPPTMPIEIIIVDNASSDGTWEWLESQTSTIHRLQMGKPVGAIKAFTEGAKLATAKYVLFATDDIYFSQRAIIAAFTHLEKTPSCGAVTFMHNKRRKEFSADYAPVMIDGQKVMKPYTQIALIRKDVGDLVGWWGGDHPVMSQGFTYAGDNFLSSGIWQSGYTVDTVPNAINYEDVFEDESRKLNNEGHKRDSELFFSIYPDGGFAPYIKPQFKDEERLRILFLMHYSPKHPKHRLQKRGIREAWMDWGIVYEYDYAGDFDKGVNVTERIRQVCEDFQPHIIFSQFHNQSNGITDETTRVMRQAAPRAVMLNWNGDVWTKNIEDPKTQNMIAPYDLLIFTNAQLAEIAVSMGFIACYTPHYFEPIADCDLDLTQPAYEVLFTGTAYSGWRLELMKFLRHLPHKVGLYGQAKDVQLDGNTHYDWSITRGLYKNAKLIVSDQQFDDAKGYVSNRMWEILATGGGLCLQQASPLLDKMTGLKAGVHYVEWKSLEELQTKIMYYLDHEDEARAIIQAAHDYVHTHHSTKHRVKSYVEAIQWLFAAS